MKEYKGYLVDEELNIYNAITGNKLRPYIGADGYLQVVRTNNGKRHYQRVHVIYAHCFIPNPNNYKYINHIDSDKTNNALSNLQWCTNSQNVYHGWHSGNRTHKNKTAVIVHDKNGEEVGRYSSIRECGKQLHLDRHKIARILKGELPRDYWDYLFDYIKPNDQS